MRNRAGPRLNRVNDSWGTFSRTAHLDKHVLSFRKSGRTCDVLDNPENLPSDVAIRNGSRRRPEATTTRREERHPVAFYPDGETHLALAVRHPDLGSVGEGRDLGRHLDPAEEVGWALGWTSCRHLALDPAGGGHGRHLACDIAGDAHRVDLLAVLVDVLPRLLEERRVLASTCACVLLLLQFPRPFER